MVCLLIGGRWDGLPVVVSFLDTLPAVRVSDVLPVPVDWLPLSVVAGIVCLWLLIGSRWDVLPVAVSSLGAGCRSDGEPVGCAPQFQR